MVFATGNNLAVSGDMSRRTLMCFLDPQVERPELRTFDRNPIEAVHADRGRYVHAALTIVRAYRQVFDAPRPEPLGSFEQWSDSIRGALIWLGMADPVETMERVRASDPRLDELTTVLTHWDSAIGSDRVSVNDLIKVADKKDTFDFNASGYKHEHFRDALLAIAGIGGAINAKRLGKWLAANKGRIVEGRLIEQLTLSAGVMQWRLKKQS
jgi:putative DNA primase/helicase